MVLINSSRQLQRFSWEQKPGYARLAAALLILSQSAAALLAHLELMMYQAAGNVQITIQRTPQGLVKKAGMSREAIRDKRIVIPQNTLLLSRAFV
mgnify:CR=1 FL=1